MSNIFKGLPPSNNAKEINDNFLDILCRIEAMMQVLNFTNEQRDEYHEISKQLFEENLSKLNQERLGG